jgi:hypothetical protein
MHKIQKKNINLSPAKSNNNLFPGQSLLERCETRTAPDKEIKRDNP